MWLSTNTLCRLCTTPGALLSLSADSLHINVLQSHDKLVHNTSQKLCLWHEDDAESESIRGVLIGEKFPVSLCFLNSIIHYIPILRNWHFKG